MSQEVKVQLTVIEGARNSLNFRFSAPASTSVKEKNGVITIRNAKSSDSITFKMHQANQRFANQETITVLNILIAGFPFTDPS